jgi:hypothetical protein
MDAGHGRIDHRHLAAEAAHRLGRLHFFLRGLQATPGERLGVPFWAVSLSFSTPPRLDFLKYLESALTDSERQNSSQNLHNKDLTSQNLESMGLMGRFLTASVLADIAASTSSAWAMMERIGGRAQGQMSRV